MTMRLQFPGGAPIGSVSAWAAERTPPIGIGPAVGTVDVPYPLVGLAVDGTCDDLSFLEDVDPRLHHLVINGDEFPPSQLEILTRFDRLRHLGLAGQKVDDATVSLVNRLPSVDAVFLFNTSVTDAGIAALDLELTQLVVSEFLRDEKLITDRTAVTVASKWPATNLLILWYTGLTDAAFEPIGRLGRLESLYLDGNRAITGEGLGHLRGLTELASLHLAKTAVDDVGLAQLSGLENLERLGLNETHVSDESIDVILRLPKLRACPHRDTRLTAEGARRLEEGLRAKHQPWPVWRERDTVGVPAPS
jgi:hypothetical protein